MRRAVLVRGLVVVIAAAAAIGLATPGASAVPVNGFAYQDLRPFTEFGEFYERGLALPYARAIVAYDVVDHPASMAATIAWVQRMQQRGREVLISFNYPDGATSSTWPPHEDIYIERVTRFRDALIDNGAAVSEFTAWNEPNHTPSSAPLANPSAALAAKYFKKLHALCQIPVNGRTCTVTAGDFSDAVPTDGRQFTAYVDAYRNELASGPDRVTPTRWAIHPYRALEANDFNRVESWIDTQTGSAEIWITEIGAMYCQARFGWLGGPDARTPGDPATAASHQNMVAQRLNTALATRTRITRTYYYSLGGADPQSQNEGFRHCDVEPPWDSWLIGDQYGYTYPDRDYRTLERPALRALFPNAPRIQAPSVSDIGATDVRPLGARLAATIDTHRLTTTYRFEYGPTSSYGRSTPDVEIAAGSSPVAVTAPVNGLDQGTTYHVRLVATNGYGTTVATGTFTTLTSRWHPWYRVDQSSVAQDGGIATSARHENQLDLFATGTDGQMWQQSWSAPTWWLPGWIPLGGVLSGAPSSASWDFDRIDTFVTGPDQRLWQRFWQRGSNWSGWIEQGSDLTSSPAVVAWGPGRLDVFARGADNTLRHRWFDSNLGWSLWESLGGELTSAPAAAHLGPGRLIVMARDRSGGVAYITYDGGSEWSRWQTLGGAAIVGAPTVTSWGPGRVDVFARGTDNQVWHTLRSRTAEWIGYWEALGGAATAAPAATSRTPGTIDLFARGTDGAVWHRAYAP